MVSPSIEFDEVGEYEKKQSNRRRVFFPEVVVQADGRFRLRWEMVIHVSGGEDDERRERTRVVDVVAYYKFSMRAEGSCIDGSSNSILGPPQGSYTLEPYVGRWPMVATSTGAW